MSARKHFPVIGNRYNDYTVISEEIKKIDGKICFDVECVCGKREFKQARHLKTDRCKSCKSCSSKRTAALYGTPNNTKHKQIGQDYYRLLGYGASKRRLEFNISPIYLIDLINKQDYKCKLSGLNIDFEDKTASLDRINNNLGYIEGNVQWLHKDVNKLKWAFDQDYLLYLCQQITTNESNSKTK